MKNAVFTIAVTTLLFILNACKHKVPSTSEPIVASNADTKSEKSNVPDTLFYRNQVLKFEEIDSNLFVKLSATDKADSFADKLFDSANVEVHDSTIILKRENGDTIMLVSNPNAPTDAVMISDYKGFLPSLNSYLVEDRYIESGDFALINRLTGKETAVYGQPVISPNGKYIVCSNFDIMTGESVNGFQLLAVRPDGLDIIWEVNPNGWGPMECRWADDQTLCIKIGYTESDLQWKILSKCFRLGFPLLTK